MMTHPRDFPFHELSVEERLLLVEDIWDSIAADTGALELTEAQREELDRRLAAYDANPNDTITWEEVKQRIDKLRESRRRPHADETRP
jgi:putative addiction module component (TIGR02574 family)